MRIFFPLSGDDVFISYSRRDGALYAAGLADKLTERKLSCFIDKLGTEPNHDLPPSLRKKIRNCTVFVLIGTEKATQSKFVEKEIVEFKQTGRTILPIDFNENVGKAIWYEQIPGLAVESEKNPQALETGSPSQNVTSFIEKSFNYTRRNQHMFRLFWGALGLFFVLIGLGAGSYLIAKNQADKAAQKAAEQEARAEAASNLANTKTRDAEIATNRANSEANRAKEQEQIANAMTEKANKATEIAEEKTILAEEKTKLAEEKTKIAAAAAKKADEQTRKAEIAENRKNEAEQEAAEQETIATARGLAVQSRSASDKTQTSVALGAYSPERSVLLAIESLKTLHTPEGMQSLFDAVLNLTNQAFKVDLIGEESNLSVRTDGKFLGIVQENKSYLRSVKTNQFSDWLIPEPDVDKILFSENGQRFAAVSSDTAFVRDTETLDNLILLPLSKKSSDVALNYDGTQLIERAEKVLGICKLEPSKCVLSPNGEWLAVLDESDVMQIINVETGRRIGVPKKWSIKPERLALSYDGNLLAAANEHNVQIWKVEEWRELGSLPHEWNLREMVFTSDNQWLTTITAEVGKDPAELSETILIGSVVRVWNINNRRLVMNVSLAQENGIKDYNFTSDGKILVTTSPVLANSANEESADENTNKKNARVWILPPTDLIKMGCSLLSRNLSDSEWFLFIKNRSGRERETCQGLPIPLE